MEAHFPCEILNQLDLLEDARGVTSNLKGIRRGVDLVHRFQSAACMVDFGETASIS
jgi:hypothetical protein